MMYDGIYLEIIVISKITFTSSWKYLMCMCSVHLINSRQLFIHGMLHTWTSQKRKLKDYSMEEEDHVKR